MIPMSYLITTKSLDAVELVFGDGFVIINKDLLAQQNSDDDEDPSSLLFCCIMPVLTSVKKSFRIRV